MIRKLMEFLGIVGKKNSDPLVVAPTRCGTLDTSTLLAVLDEKAGQKKSKSLGLFFWTFVIVFVFSSRIWAQVQIQARTMDDTSRLSLSGVADWQYKIQESRNRGEKYFSIQIDKIKEEELQSVKNFRDSRIERVRVLKGENDGVVLEIYPTSNAMTVFDYQTESPKALVFDIFKEKATASTSPKKKVTKVDPHAQKLAKFLAPDQVVNSRSPAATDQPIDASGANKTQEAFLGVRDGADPNYSRFEITPDEIKEMSLIKSERQIYLHFPGRYTEDNLAKRILDERPGCEVEGKNNRETQSARLFCKLYNQEKYAVALRTLDFIRKEFPDSKHMAYLELMEADIFFRLWRKEGSTGMFDRAITKFKTHLIKQPKSPERHRLLMLIGLSYMDRGNYLDTLSSFQTGVRTNPDSPYLWKMRMAIAESLRRLGKIDEALEEYSFIEDNPASGNLGVEARYKRGDAFFAMKDYSNAVKEYRDAVQKYPTKWSDGPNAFFNSAESQFWLKNYQVSLEAFKEYLRKFPSDSYSGYAMTRIGEILEILGAPEKKYVGAFLEAMFRYPNTPGATIAKIHVTTKRFPILKQKEIETFQKEIKQTNLDQLEGLDLFLVLKQSDGFLERKDFDQGLKDLLGYYQKNTLSPHLPLIKGRIVHNFVAQMREFNSKKDPIETVRLYTNQKQTWFKGSERVDLRYETGVAFENLSLYDEAKNLLSEAVKMRDSFKDKELMRRLANEWLPKPEQIRLRLAEVSYKSGDLKAARNHLNEIEDMAQLSLAEHVEGTLLFSELAEKQERYEDAEKALLALQDHWASKPEALANVWLKLGDLKMKSKNQSEALTWFGKIASVAEVKNPGLSVEEIQRSVETYGDLSLWKNKKDDALKAYKTLVEKYPDKIKLASWKYKIGKIHFDSQNYAEASKVWNEIKTDDPTSIWNQLAANNLKQVDWQKKYSKYVDRLPAGEKNETR